MKSGAIDVFIHGGVVSTFVAGTGSSFISDSRLLLAVVSSVNNDSPQADTSIIDHKRVRDMTSYDRPLRNL